MNRSLISLLLLAHVPVMFWAFAPPQNADALWPIPGQTPREPDRVALQVRPEAIALAGSHAPSAAPAQIASPTQAQPDESPKAAPAPAVGSPAASSAAPRLPAAPSSPPVAAPTAPAVQPVQNPGRQQEAEQPPKP